MSNEKSKVYQYAIVWNGKSGWGNEIKCQNKSWLYSLILVAHQRSSSGPIHLKMCHDFEVIPQDVYASTSALIKNCKSFCQCVSYEAINLYPVGHELCVEKNVFPLSKRVSKSNSYWYAFWDEKKRYKMNPFWKMYWII